MRKVVFSILLMILPMSFKAQNLTAPSSENTGIAVFKGKIKGVPDGTVVNFWMPENGDYVGEAVAKVVKGKFSFKKRINDYTKYLITLGDAKEELVLCTASGTTTITGDSPDCSRWRVENDNPMVVEENAYRDRRKFIWKENEKRAKLEEKKEQKNPDVYADEHFYIKSMCEFMQNRPYSRFYLDELRTLIEKAECKGGYDSQWRIYRKMVRELFVKIPFKKLDEFQGFYLYPTKVLNVGDDMVDFTLYDHKGNKHQLTELNGNGKYLLLEFCRKEDKDMMKSRPDSLLNELYDKYSDYFDIVTVNCDSEAAWKSGKLPRDRWNEWNDYKSSVAVVMEYSTIYRYVFVSTKGVIMGFGNDNDFMDKARRHFHFVK